MMVTRNFVQDAITGEEVLSLPPEWNYEFVLGIYRGNSKWDYSIAFISGIKGEGAKFCEDHYDYQKLKQVAASWDLKGHNYSILECMNPRITRGEYHGLPLFNIQYLMMDKHYAPTESIHLTRAQRQQLADGWGISLEDVIRQTLLLRFKPRETPSCSISKGEEWFMDIEFSVPPVSTEEIVLKIGEIIAFHNKEIAILHQAYYNTLNTSKERQYYRDVWAFDPAVERIYTLAGKEEDLEGKELYRYEAWYSLENDPPLHSINVMIGAVVQAIQKRSNNKIIPKIRIAFQRGKQRQMVECLHVIILPQDEKDIPTVTEKNFLLSRSSLSSAILSIPEHFVALKSYVAGIAGTGVLRILWDAFTTNSEEMEQLGFGFNPAMQFQVMRALGNLAPAAVTAIKRDWLMQIIDSVPSEWFISHITLLVENGLLGFEMRDISRIFPENWLRENEAKLAPFFRVLRDEQSRIENEERS